MKMTDFLIQKKLILWVWILFFIFADSMISGCAESDIIIPPPTPPITALKPMDYCIQVGAFMNIDNAIGLMDKLNSNGLDAYYFKHPSGLYKVRFGNYSTESLARETAAQLQTKGVIEAYILIKPEDYAAAQVALQGNGYLREQLVKTAENFIGMPYHWGGTSPRNGFDCSGLTLTIYRLNGLELERTSQGQYRMGKPRKKEELQRGDLVFFTPHLDHNVSHVGIYIGENKFIHATSPGKNVRIDLLSQDYYVKRYVGARAYL
jgi:hypothetical protein